MEGINIDVLRKLKSECAITEEEYNKRILEFSKDFLMKDMKLEVLGVIEKGTFGGVFAAREPGAWEKLSVKVVLKEKCSILESENWPSLKHPNILRLLLKRYIPRIDAYIFVSELFSYTLEMYLEDKWFLRYRNTLIAVKQFLRDILQGLNYLHQRNCNYINFTAKNIWISNDFKAILTNFDSLELAINISKEREALLQHGPPELYKPFIRRKDSIRLPNMGVFFDVWNYGCLALNIFTKNYVQKKVPREITNWCDEVYPVIFKILQRDCFKKYCKDAFPASKIDGKDTDIMRNFVSTCLTIHPEKRPFTKTLFEHRYFKINGFASVIEDTWSKKVDVQNIWKFISRPSTNEIIEIKKQSLVKAIASTSESEGHKFENESCGNENTKNFRILDRGKQTHFPLAGSSKDKIPKRVQSQAIIQDYELNSCDIAISSQCAEPKILPETNSEVLQQEGDFLEETDVDINACNNLVETKLKESELEEEYFDDFSATAIFNWLKPTFIKLPTMPVCDSPKLSKWIAYQNTDVEKLSLKNEETQKEELKVSPLDKFECRIDDLKVNPLEENSFGAKQDEILESSDVAIDYNEKGNFHVLQPRKLSPHSSTRSIFETYCKENLENLSVFEHYPIMVDSRSQSLQLSTANRERSLVYHKETKFHYTDDLTQLKRDNNLPCIVGSEEPLQDTKAVPTTESEMQRIFIDSIEKSRTRTETETKDIEEKNEDRKVIF